ncbi:MAG: hypothetical protein FWD31_12260, partial [Planctomycetaceae bacterium]|nr:hypothetical protein [Planctomycetaceae bacterium]
MRRFKICVLFFVAVVVVAQAAMAQSQQQYNLDGYKKDYKTGYASTVGAVTIQGQVFRPADGRFFFGYEGIELT